MAVSPLGALAGFYLEGGKEYGFMDSARTYTRLRFPGSIETNATAINASDVVAGNYESAKEQYFGFVYSGGTYTTINVPGAIETFVEGINAKGEVTGYYFNGSQDLGFIATPQSAAVI